MQKQFWVFLVVVVLLGFSGVSSAESLEVNINTSIEIILENNINKTVTVKLASGDELTGVVHAVNGAVVHLGALLGKEFYDAVISRESIAAVIVRVRDK